MAHALSLETVTVAFGDYTVVASTDLHVEQGEFVSVVGPTGCGKSTLLNLAAGLRAPNTGVVRVGGVPLRGLNRQAGYLFQGESLMPWRTARDNVAAGPEFSGQSRAAARAAADAWLGRVGLTGHGAKYPHQMSGGMRKRAQLAQTLVMDPPILLMDEPFSALDVQTRLMMENELLRLWESGSATARERTDGSGSAGARERSTSGSATARERTDGSGSAGASERSTSGSATARERPDGSGSAVAREYDVGNGAKKSVLFITHDLEEAISLSDRVIVLSAGPATTPIAEFAIDLPRPRDVAEIRLTPAFQHLQEQIWSVLRAEVLRAYQAGLAA